MDLLEAEGWWSYWETNGCLADADGADEERAAASLLHTEYDRRGAALDEARAEIERLRAERDQAWERLRSNEHAAVREAQFDTDAWNAAAVAPVSPGPECGWSDDGKHAPGTDRDRGECRFCDMSLPPTLVAPVTVASRATASTGPLSLEELIEHVENALECAAIEVEIHELDIGPHGWQRTGQTSPLRRLVRCLRSAGLLDERREENPE